MTEWADRMSPCLGKHLTIISIQVSNKTLTTGTYFHSGNFRLALCKDDTEHTLITKHNYGNCTLLMCTYIAFLCSIAIFISLSNFPSQSVNFKLVTPQSPISVDARCKVQVCGSLVAGNASSNMAGVMEVSMWMFCIAKGRSLIQRGVSVSECGQVQHEPSKFKMIG